VKELDMSVAPEPAIPFLARCRPALQWLLLAVPTAAITALLLTLRLPAPLLLGPMFAGIALGAQGATVRLPTRAYQAVEK